MMGTIHSTSPFRSPVSQNWRRDSERFDLSEFNLDSHSRPASTPSHRPVLELNMIVPKLFQMNLSSLSGYVEAADLATDLELRDFAQVMIRQRMAQCRSLLMLAPNAANPATSRAVCPLRLAWLRALWSLEQDDFVSFAQSAERAESLLEEAFVEAADAVVDRSIAARFYELAINVCGARERFDEFSFRNLEAMQD